MVPWQKLMGNGFNAMFTRGRLRPLFWKLAGIFVIGHALDGILD